jgi:hypothetical protein
MKLSNKIKDLVIKKFDKTGILVHVSEAIVHGETEYKEPADFGQKRTKVNEEECRYNATVHEHPSIMPTSITPEDTKAIKYYCSPFNNSPSASTHMNNYLRNRSGDNSASITQMKMHKDTKKDDSKFREAVNNLANSFTPENTNRIPLITYGGIPKKIGEKIGGLNGGEFHIPGFTSTSTDFSTAHAFAKSYTAEDKRNFGETDGIPHVVRYHIQAGNKDEAGPARTFAIHSGCDEEEVGLNHGVSGHHIKSTFIPYPNQMEDSNVDPSAPKPKSKKGYWLHDVVIHSGNRKSLDNYEREYT